MWAPQASEVALEVLPAEFASQWLINLIPTPADSPLLAPEAPPEALTLPLQRCDDGTWAARFPAGTLGAGACYRVALRGPDGAPHTRRDPYARAVVPGTAWCTAVDASSYEWVCDDADTWTPPPATDHLIYELHVGSFTEEGNLVSAILKLPHVAALGMTAVQLLPLCQHSDRWGYSPEQLLALHASYGSPDDLRMFVDAAHAHGLAVIVDLSLFHGAPVGNALWNYDGWESNHNGGIYHEGAPDTRWGRAFAYWKREVVTMAGDAAEMYLREYRVDGLRFDSASDMPPEAVAAITARLRAAFPDRLLTAEATPENAASIMQLGFDAVSVHSNYFDIMQQHKALGRGHHGGGDWAEGWDVPRLRSAVGMHHGLEQPQQCIKYFLGSHDQVGCQRGGAHDEDYRVIGGQHRYACDQLGAGRNDASARAAARAWHAANVAAAGTPLLFMGTEWAQTGWWDVSQEQRLNWGLADDAIGRQMVAAFAAANALRRDYPALRRGWPTMLHEDRPNGIMVWERMHAGDERVVTVVNAGRNAFQAGEYGAWVGRGTFRQVFCSADEAFGGDPAFKSTGGEPLHAHDGKLYLNLPPTSTTVFVQLMPPAADGSMQGVWP